MKVEELMDSPEPNLPPEIITECKDWLAEIESLSKCVLKWTEKYNEMVTAQVEETDTFADILKFLSISQRSAKKAINITAKSALELQPQIASEPLVQMRCDVRSAITGISASVFLMRDISNKIECNDNLKRTLGKIVAYAEILDLISTDYEPFDKAGDFRMELQDT